MNVPKSLNLYSETAEPIAAAPIIGFIKKYFGPIKTNMIGLKEKAVRTHGLFVDFISTSESLEKQGYLAQGETCHVLITDKLFATLDEHGRIHIRAALFAWPSIISLSGIVEGPARPKDYYIFRRKYSRLGIWDTRQHKIKEKFQARFIDYGDGRITDVLKGYISQALFYYIHGEPFCARKSCRLYNAHWQEDLIYAQITRGAFCARHAALLLAIKSRTSARKPQRL